MYMWNTPERKMSSLQDGKIAFERNMSPRNCSSANMWSSLYSVDVVPGWKTQLVITRLKSIQGRRLRGERGERPPQKVGWRGRKCFYPPQYLENVLQITM